MILPRDFGNAELFTEPPELFTTSGRVRVGAQLACFAPAMRRDSARMAKSPKTIPGNYPQPLGTQILKAETFRQISILRQEMATELLSILADAREPAVRSRLIRLIEANLSAGLTTARRAEDLWPDLDEAKEIIESAGAKPSVAQRNLKLFLQFNDLQTRTLQLLNDSFGHVRLILDRVQPAPSPTPNPAAAPAARR